MRTLLYVDKGNEDMERVGGRGGGQGRGKEKIGSLDVRGLDKKCLIFVTKLGLLVFFLFTRYKVGTGGCS